MTYAPASIKAAQVYLRDQTGLPWVSLGIVGDEDHRGGYHCGWDRRRIVNGKLSDYAWTESSRDSGHRTDAASALDIGKFTKGDKNLRTFSVWLVQQCKAGAPDTRDIREVIYSPDGKTVKRWDRLGKRTSGDDSHLDHTHISYHRDSEARDKVGLFKRYFEGGSSPSLPSSVAEPTLREGDEGTEVGKLQSNLNEAVDARLAVDEDYGPATTNGVKLLQRTAGIDEDGIYGDDSAAALRNLLEDDMPLTDADVLKVWSYKNSSITGRDAYAHLIESNGVLALKKQNEAILAKLAGADTKQILDAINARASEDAERDAALLTELGDLASGGATAQEIVDQLAVRLAGGE
jgi:hypothetical protein